MKGVLLRDAPQRPLACILALPNVDMKKPERPCTPPIMGNFYKGFHNYVIDSISHF